jgi:indole-3-glycerol phosphate synthase
MSGPSANVLEQIITARRRRVEQTRLQVPLSKLETAADARADFRNFASAISGPTLRVIAELKKASPSRGVMRADYNPAEIARGYEAAGASALSVLTEEDNFSGSLEDLKIAREAVQLPVLRKDFIVDEYQVFESAAAGADALLMIVAALADTELKNLIGLCRRLHLAALVEVHDERELDRALAVGAKIIGVNNRDLRTLEVDLETSFRLRPRIPSGCVAVSESGIQSPADLRRLGEARYDAVLIGERFMKAADPGRELAEMINLAWETARPRK